MPKLKLEVESLEVQSFATVPEDGEERGTVHAHSEVGPCTAIPGSCGETCIAPCYTWPCASETCDWTATAYPCCPQTA
jgi:hypothetical protein